MSDFQDIPDDGALSAEYVLRLMDAEAEQAFERRLANEPALRAEVHAWEAQFATLADVIPDAAPSDATRADVLAKIAGPAVTQDSWWKRSFGWVAIPSAAAVAVAAFVLLTPMLRGPAFDPILHATLLTADGSLQVEAGYSPAGMQFKILRPVGDPQPGRALQAWVIGPNGEGPVSLGVLPDARETTFAIPQDIVDLLDGGTFAVSDEPVGGSPTGAPTGEILATDEFFDV